MSQFCKDCKWSSGMGRMMECEKTREHWKSPVTGEKFSSARLCVNLRNYVTDCPNFDPKRTLWQRIKEVLNVN